MHFDMMEIVGHVFFCFPASRFISIFTRFAGRPSTA